MAGVIVTSSINPPLPPLIKLEILRKHFFAKLGTIKGRNGMDLTKDEDIKKRWQKNTDLNKQKKLMTWITTMV